MYDPETGLYYLQSRYYDPATCRFISPDNVVGANSDFTAFNLYLYCGNNPINRYDTAGNRWKNVICAILHEGNMYFRSLGMNTAILGEKFLCMEEAEQGSGIYHARFDCWQRMFGYNQFYDIVFDLATNMDPFLFPFLCDGNWYTIWMWKGDYINLGAGAELGIYRGNGYYQHCIVDTSLAIDMNLLIKHGTDFIVEYSPTEYQWWITGFNSNNQWLNIRPEDLTVYVGITFKDYNMYQAFRLSVLDDSRWQFQTSTLFAMIIF